VKERNQSSRLRICVSTAALVVVALAWTSGCSRTYRFYNGKPRAAEEIALVKGAYDRAGEHVTIIAVDGKILNMDRGALAAEYHNVEIPPGKHTIRAQIVCEKQFKTGPRKLQADIRVDARAGHVYQLHAELKKGSKVEFHVKDVTEKDK